MGVDLTLLPLDCDYPTEDDRPAFQFSHSMLRTERRRELWPLIEKLEQGEVSPGFTSFMGTGPDGEHGYGKTVETAYGSPVKWATAGNLAKLATNHAVTNDAKNRAVWAYLSALDPDTKVALYWH